jgi:Tfp pilus assembly protein FimT
MLFVIAVTALIAGLIMPNLIIRKQGRDEWEFRTSLRSIGKNAKSRAVEIGRTVSLAFDKSKNQLQVIELDQLGSEKITKTVDMPSWISVTRFVANQDESVSDQWRVPFYSDGGTTGGGLQFQVGERTWSLVVSPTDASIKDLDGTLPDYTYESWPAGDNVAPSS